LIAYIAKKTILNIKLKRRFYMRLRLNGLANNYNVFNAHQDLDFNPLGIGDSIYYLAANPAAPFSGHAGKQAGLQQYWNTPVPGGGLANNGRNPWTNVMPPNGRADWRIGTVLALGQAEETASLGEQVEQSINEFNSMSAVDLLETVQNSSSGDQKKFTDEDGLISFVNLTSSFVKNAPEFKTGQRVLDKVSNFFATLRDKCYSALIKNPALIPAGDRAPKDRWSPAVTHLMKIMLEKTGALTNYKVNNTHFSHTMTLANFSGEFIKTLFDVAVVPPSIILKASEFITNVGNSLRTQWDKTEKNYTVGVLSQCHEAVPLDDIGKDYYYFPKIKYLYLDISSKQTEFTSSCVDVKNITFNFNYEYYVTALIHDILDENSTMYKMLTAFLDKAQGISYKEAENILDEVLEKASDKPKTFLSTDGKTKISEIEALGVDITKYPRLETTPPLPIENILNSMSPQH